MSKLSNDSLEYLKSVHGGARHADNDCMICHLVDRVASLEAEVLRLREALAEVRAFVLSRGRAIDDNLGAVLTIINDAEVAIRNAPSAPTSGQGAAASDRPSDACPCCGATWKAFPDGRRGIIQHGESCGCVPAGTCARCDGEALDAGEACPACVPAPAAQPATETAKPMSRTEKCDAGIEPCDRHCNRFGTGTTPRKEGP